MYMCANGRKREGERERERERNRGSQRERERESEGGREGGREGRREFVCVREKLSLLQIDLGVFMDN